MKQFLNPLSGNGIEERERSQQNRDKLVVERYLTQRLNQQGESGKPPSKRL